jgi:hypothetical protein
MMRLTVIALFGVLCGCGLVPAKQHKPDPVVARVLPPPTPRTDGAIYQAGQQSNCSPISRRAVSATC